jgi:succinate dehydrogenase hydrophobic anchor subunit
MEVNNLSNENRNENVWIWLVKIIAGLLIILFLTVHFVVNHLLAPEGLLTYSDIVHYYSNPIVPIMEIGFLIFVVMHSFLGVRGILLDLNPSQKLIKIINISFILLGGFAIIYGSWLVLVLVMRGSG